MNLDKKLGLNRKNKLLCRKDGVTSQIVDYYNRFGQNRDLEQYLTFSNTDAGQKCPNIQSETSSNFSTARCLLTDGENHSACPRKDIATQKIIDSDSDDNHTMKYSMKPPEHFNDYRERPSTSAVSKKEFSIKFDSKTKFAIANSDGKSDESSHEIISAREDIDQNLESSLNKAGSPTNSITSRKLEWDSLADVGYENVGQNKNPHENLSTLERMALDGHLKSGNNTKRGDDKKRSTSNEISSQIPNFSQVGSPDAQSTPIPVSLNKSPVVAVKRKSILRGSLHKNCSSSGKSRGKVSLKDRQHRSHTSNLNSSNLKIDMTKHFSINVDINNSDQNRRKVASDPCIRYEQLEHVPSKDKDSQIDSDLQDNVLLKPKAKRSDNEKTNDRFKSVSLSDIPKVDKEIQTSSRQNVSTAAQTSSRVINNELATDENLIDDRYNSFSNILAKGPIILNVVKTQPVLRSKKKRLQYSAVSLSVTPSNLVHESPESDHIEGIDVNFDTTSPLAASRLKCGESLLSRAESFEYMPGHMFQNNNVSPVEDILDAEKSIPESSLVTVTPESSQPFTSSSGEFDSKDDELINFQTSSCFEHDLDANIKLINKFAAQRHNDPELKKRLIKQVVTMLVKADYPGDGSGKSPRNYYGVSSSSKDSSNHDNKIKGIPNIEEAMVKVDPSIFDETDILLKRTAFYKQIFIKSRSFEEIVPQTKPGKGTLPKENQSAPASLAISGRIIDKFSKYDLGTKVMCDKSVQPSISTNSTNKCPTQSYESNSTACSSTPDRSNRISPMPVSELTKSKSEYIYEQYLIAKRQEDIKKKQTTLNKWTLVKKMQDFKDEQSKTEHDSISTKNSSSSNDSIKETRLQLAMINNEIIQLNILKTKLENKNKLKSSFDNELLQRDKQAAKHMPNQEAEVYSLMESIKMPKLNQKSDKNHVQVPMLDLRKSSDESSMNTISNSDERSLQSISNIKNDTPTSPEDPSISKSHLNDNYKTEIPIESLSNDMNSKTEGVKSPQSLPNRRHRLFAHKKSEDLKKVKILYKTDIPEIRPQCKCEHPSSQNFQSTTTILKKSSKSQFDVSKEQFGILCSCCRSNLLSSDTSSQSNKQSPQSEIISATKELQKLEKIFAKYQKCKVMKSFMEDYENLILKYRKMKEKKIVSDILNDKNEEKVNQKFSTGQNTSNMGNIHLISLNEKIKKFNEGIATDEFKIPPLPENNDSRPKSASILISDSSIQKEIEPVVEKKTGSTGMSPRTDSIVSQNINIEKPPEEKFKCICVDATTSPIAFYSGEKDHKLELSPESLDLSDKFVLKVKKVVSQEYNDLAKKIDHIQEAIEHQSKNYLKISSNFKNTSEDINENNTIEKSATTKPPLKISEISKSDDRIIGKDLKNSDNSCIDRNSLCVDKNDEHISHLEATRSRGSTKNTIKKNEILCLCPKSKKLALDLHSCRCHKRIARQNYIFRLIKEAKKEADLPIPKPIAYNLILEPSESVLEETIQKMKRQSLEDVIVKVPKRPGAQIKHTKDFKQSLRNFKTISKSSDLENNENEEKGSTDEQIKEFSSLDEEFSDKLSVIDFSNEEDSAASSGISSGKENIRPKTENAKKKSMSVEEYLRVNKPRFIDEADKRRECLRRYHILREQRDAQRRKVLSLGVSNLPNIKDISTSDLHQLANQYGITFSHAGKSRIFNSHDMVKNTARQYKKLPEVQSKRHDLKKQQSKKTNLLMADLFAKKLREKALKGVVNISHSSNVITI